MRNLYPLTARAEVEADIARAAAAAEQNRHPSGIGFTDLYMVETPSTGYADLGLTLARAEAALAPILPRVRRFNATVFSAMGGGGQDPFGSYDDDAWCFGLGAHCYVKLDAKGPLVDGIWFDLNTDDADAIARLRRAMEAIDAIAPSVVADYFLDFSGPVAEAGTLDHYFAELEESRRNAERAMLEYRAGDGQRAQPPGLIRKLFAIFGRAP
ncbi:hypothetical protein [Sphingomonas colocasiae]|uniref:Uncharacterized protein n=1 Tax=Sphingomonas colocasiae TaxID=1848973 RepID=A0ABS7PUL4_9SPHN|nr:hypothetical protein [Sphingomonas colocasiae]MBY8825050.1 hypothetical protein [Sphingomonas colocasiae]